MSYEDLREHGSESAVKAAGKLRQQGKPYESQSFLSIPFFSFFGVLTMVVVVDGDIAYWKSGA